VDIIVCLINYKTEFGEVDWNGLSVRFEVFTNISCGFIESHALGESV
jgi:hypothetical protein